MNILSRKTLNFLSVVYIFNVFYYLCNFLVHLPLTKVGYSLFLKIISLCIFTAFSRIFSILARAPRKVTLTCAPQTKRFLCPYRKYFQILFEHKHNQKNMETFLTSLCINFPEFFNTLINQAICRLKLACHDLDEKFHYVIFTTFFRLTNRQFLGGKNMGVQGVQHGQHSKQH